MFGCELLLSLSAELERENNRGRLRLQRNGDGTSSLWERSSDRLVVTYRDDGLVRNAFPFLPPPPPPLPPRSCNGLVMGVTAAAPFVVSGFRMEHYLLEYHDAN